MKTFLTSTEFVHILFSRFELLVENQKASATDRIALYLFEACKKNVVEHLVECFNEYVKQEGERNAQNFIGYSFHCGFRKIDVTRKESFDHIIHAALSEAPLFWSALSYACKAVDSKDVAEFVSEELNNDINIKRKI